MQRTNTTIDVYFKSTKKTWETTFKEGKKTPSQELDEKEEEDKIIQEKELDLNEIEQENLGGIGDGIEISKEKGEKEDEKAKEEEKNLPWLNYAIKPDKSCWITP